MKLLLHICCAPCAVYPVKLLIERGINFEGYFYNPNIHPPEEFQRRKESVELLASKYSFVVHYSTLYSEIPWLQLAHLPSQRCDMCYLTRMNQTAKYAADHQFDSFTTSLLISPYQNHNQIIKNCDFSAEKYGVEFYYEDFRLGFREGQTSAKELQLYRQKYCGCFPSIAEAEKQGKKKKSTS